MFINSEEWGFDLEGLFVKVIIAVLDNLSNYYYNKIVVVCFGIYVIMRS